MKTKEELLKEKETEVEFLKDYCAQLHNCFDTNNIIASRVKMLTDLIGRHTNKLLDLQRQINEAK